jgi:UDP-N-acetylglucosamine 2-epimerase
MKLVSIVGARPQFIKLAPVVRSFERAGRDVDNVIVHTGQHYDAALSDIFFDELRVPAAAVNLEVGSGSHGSQTGKMLERIEQVLLDMRPDMVIIYGDTNSTVAGALAAAKLQIPVAHVEAGVRSFNRRMPEEINRVAADHASDLLLAPTRTAIDNLDREGLSDRAVLTGDVMYDAIQSTRQGAAEASTILERLALTPAGYAVVTIHRAENTDDPERLRKVMTGLNEIAGAGLPLVFPIHPRTSALVSRHLPGWLPHQALRLIDPIGYMDMLSLVGHARMALTDSGGLQKDAFFMGCPCITLREDTEWVETVDAGGNYLVGVEPDRMRHAVATWNTRIAAGDIAFSSRASALFGNGRAADRIRDAVLAFLETGSRAPAAVAG